MKQNPSEPLFNTNDQKNDINQKRLAELIEQFEKSQSLTSEQELAFIELIKNGVDPNFNLNPEQDTLLIYSLKTDNIDLCYDLIELIGKDLITNLNEIQKKTFINVWEIL